MCMPAISQLTYVPAPSLCTCPNSSSHISLPPCSPSTSRLAEPPSSRDAPPSAHGGAHGGAHPPGPSPAAPNGWEAPNAGEAPVGTSPAAESPGPGPSTAAEEQDVDAYLGNVWKDVKKDLRGNLGPEEARVLETISVRGREELRREGRRREGKF